MKQCEKILRHLERHGSITQVEATEEYGIMRLASRINDLRRLGERITTEWEKGMNRDGETVRYAVYRWEAKV